MVIASLLIQGIFAFELYMSLPSLEETEQLAIVEGMSWCSVPADLTCCAALVFCILMFDNVPSLITASKIRFSAFKCSHMLVEKIVSHRADRLLTVSFLANIVSRRTMRMQQRTDQIR